MTMHERSRDSGVAASGDASDRWAEVVLALACAMTLIWIGFTLWLAVEVLGRV